MVKNKNKKNNNNNNNNNKNNNNNYNKTNIENELNEHSSAEQTTEEQLNEKELINSENKEINQKKKNSKAEKKKQADKKKEICRIQEQQQDQEEEKERKEKEKEAKKRKEEEEQEKSFQNQIDKQTISINGITLSKFPLISICWDSNGDIEYNKRIISKASKSLLNLISSFNLKSFRHQVIFESGDSGSNKYIVEVVLNSLEWYSYSKDHLESNSLSENSINFSLSSNKQHIAIFNNEVDVPKFNSIKNSQSGKSTSQLIYDCKKQITRLTGTEQCKQKIYDDKLVFSNDDLYVLSRAESTRESIIIPVGQLCEDLNHNSETMISSEAFWSIIHNVLELFGDTKPSAILERVVTNFGQWETAINQDGNLTNCHPHSHLWYQLKFVKSLNVSNQYQESLKTLLEDRFERPEDYLLKNAKELQNIVSPNQLINISNKLTHFESRFDNMDSRLDNMDSRLDKVDSRLDKVDSRLDKVDSRLDNMDSRLDNIDSRLDKVDSRLDNIDSRLDKVDSRLDNIDSRLDKVDSRLDNIDSRLDKVDSRLDELQSQLNTFQSQFNTFQSQFNTFQSQIITALQSIQK